MLLQPAEIVVKFALLRKYAADSVIACDILHLVRTSIPFIPFLFWW